MEPTKTTSKSSSGSTKKQPKSVGVDGDDGSTEKKSKEKHNDKSLKADDPKEESAGGGDKKSSGKSSATSTIAATTTATAEISTRSTTTGSEGSTATDTNSSATTTQTASTESSTSSEEVTEHCDLIEDGVDYWTKQPALQKVPQVESPAACALRCGEEPLCWVWTFSKEHKLCFLQALHSGEQLTRKQGADYASGYLPCSAKGHQRPGGGASPEDHSASRAGQGFIACGLMEFDTDFWTMMPAADKIPKIVAAEDCSKLCADNAECSVWTLDNDHLLCFLQRLKTNEEPVRKVKAGWVSGSRPCGKVSGKVHGPSGSLSLPSSPSLRGAVTITGLPSLPPKGPLGLIECGKQEEDVDFETKLPLLGTAAGVQSTADCVRKCFDDPRCMAWTLDKANQLCFLAELGQNERPVRRGRPGFISGGLPCNQQSMRSAGTLYCFALMQPDGYEKSLLAMTHKQKTSLFACDEFAIYSNKAIEVVPGVVSGVVNSSLKCDIGGEFKTALNLGIFVEVWKKVISDGRYLQHDWTIKVDPDAVFFPDLLKAILPHHFEVPEGVYLNNCKFGLHGPLEILSRNAVKAWDEGMGKCQQHFDQLCSGFCGWGEDMYIDQCLWKVLGARRDNEWSLLTEDHCPSDPDHIPEWTASLCNTGTIAFHPFKEPAKYTECMIVATSNPEISFK